MTEERFAPGSDFHAVNEGPSIYPYTAVAYVVSTFADGTSFAGTGVMVGPNDVLTSAQLLWDAEHGGSAVSVTVTPAYNDGIAPFGTFQADSNALSYFMIDTDGDGFLTHNEAQYDVGIIGLNANVGAMTGTFGIDTFCDTGSLMLTGYPSGFAGAGGPLMMNDYLGVTADDSFWTWDIAPGTADLRPGDIGAPLWLDNGAGPNVAGIATSEFGAVDVTLAFNDMMDWIRGNDFLLA